MTSSAVIGDWWAVLCDEEAAVCGGSHRVCDVARLTSWEAAVCGGGQRVCDVARLTT